MINTLVDRGLLVEVMTWDQLFPRKHRILPLQWAFGNLNRDVERYHIGGGAGELTVLDPFMFALWRLCRQAPDIWQLAAAIASDRDVGDRDKEVQLIRIMTALPLLLKKKAVFIDRVLSEDERHYLDLEGNDAAYAKEMRFGRRSGAISVPPSTPPSM